MEKEEGRNSTMYKVQSTMRDRAESCDSCDSCDSCEFDKKGRLDKGIPFL